MPTHLHEHLVPDPQDNQHQHHNGHPDPSDPSPASTEPPASTSNTSHELGSTTRPPPGDQSPEDEEDTNDRSLDRRLSAPARLKSTNLTSSDHSEANSDESVDKSACILDRQHTLSTRSQQTELRRHISHNRIASLYSQGVKPMTDCYRHYCRKLHHNSASPLSSSSSASDSAFSQSRSTLEGSESGSQSTNCYTPGPLLDQNEPSSRFSLQRDNDAQRLDANGAVNQSSKGIEQHRPIPPVKQSDIFCNDHFQLIWKNLSYRVPEKRFSRFKARLCQQRTRGSTTPQSSNGCQESRSARLNHPLEDGITHESHLRQDGTPPSVTCSNRQRRIIFSNLNGCVKSGQLTAILGPSGAGKTTFLKCLTNSIVNGVSGIIDIIDGSTTSHHLKLCIIPQKDYLFDNLTVMENLLFASRIKNTKTNLDHKANVNRVASLLGLQACMKLKTSKLSGGQYKRVSIAQELLSQPDILILDEPTSGLDSLTCFKTVSVLRDLVNFSRAGLMPPLAIVMTIHQPQIKIFNQFHHVYVLSSMGQCVYEGRPEYLVDTVANCCNLLPPPDDQNAASFIIDLGSEAYGNVPIEQLVKLQRETFLLSHSKKPKEYFDLISDEPKNGELIISERLRKRNNNEHSFWLHTGLLINRLWISMWRDSLLATTRISFHLIIPFVFYFVYSQKSGSANACPHVEREMDIREMVSDSNIQRLTTQHDELILTFENVSLFFLLLYSFSMCVLAVTALSFPLNMQILLKETSNGWYTMPRFVMAKMLADLPMELTMPMISVSIAYAITGQPSSYLSWRMLTVTAVMTLCSLISQTQGLLFGAYFMNNVQAAVFISQASTLPWVLLSGFTTRISELPKVLQWLSFGSIYRLGIESIVAVRYGFGTCPCNQELVDDRPTKVIGIPDQLRSVMSYYMDMYTESPDIANSSTTLGTETVANSTKPDLFEKIAATLSRANTYGVDITSCDDVRPFIMSAREVDETTLPTFIIILVSVLVGLKILLFYIVKIRAG